MICNNCGNNYDDNNNFCPHCGAKNTGNNWQTNYNFGTPQQNWNSTYGGGYGPNIQKRDILVSALLTIITCGIYGIFWFINIVDDLNYASGHTEEPSGVVVFIFSFITCGIYMLYWMYKAGDKVNEMKQRNGMMADSSNGILYLLCCFLGGGVIAYCLIQSELNRVAR